jgi:hypothetical protein
MKYRATWFDDESQKAWCSTRYSECLSAEERESGKGDQHDA